ncbi:uncharacterized protein LOC115363629 [Myripristis murdjan]|uniref:uncharacterized protein LOC115363629 n=1 Tax=Myripristis murdjan TaxID=586833 RepID=UPI0011762A36|nr:uncharacterized protein LOC115363629 [Myripristis murdjan]
MKTSLTCPLLCIQLIVACAEVIFVQRTESQSVRLSCSPERPGASLTSLHLYHSSTRGQTTLLSMAEGAGLRVVLERRGRLHVSGGLDSPQIGVTVSQLRHTDTGVYRWELTYRERNSSDRVEVSNQQVFLLVEGTGRQCQCSPRYTPLLYAIFTAVGLLLLILCCLRILICMKARHRHKPQPPAPIYEEMSRKQQTTGISQNSREAPSHLQEADFPVYANPNIRQTQENYYACPRQLSSA